MSSWKSRKPISSRQSGSIKKQKSVDEINIQQKIYNLDRRKQNKICAQIDDNLYKQKNISNMNELISAYENFVSIKRLSNGSVFLKKLREMRYQNQFNSQLDIHLVDLMSRLILEDI